MSQFIRSFSLLLLCGTFAIGCQESPSSTASSDPSFGAGKPVPAKPALVWRGAQIIQGVTYSALYVGDSTVAPSARIHTVATTTVFHWSAPTWSPSSGSVVFTQGGTGTIPDTIKAIDVSVNSKGNVVASNLRTIIGFSGTSSRMKNSFWSSTATKNQIAYTTDEGPSNSLWVVSGGGGAATQVASIDEAWAGSANGLGYPTWNADDSRLAVVRHGDNAAMIMIFNTSNWSYVDSIAVEGTVFGLEWSRTGANKLAFSLQAVGSTISKLHFTVPTTGAVPTTNDVVGVYPTWSPNNSSVLYMNAGYVHKNTPGTSTTTSVINFGGQAMKWKR